MSPPRAFVDESYSTQNRHYLLAAAIVADEMLDEARDEIATLRRRHTAPFHWHAEHPLARLAMLRAAAESTISRVAVVARPVPDRREERARAACLTTLLMHLTSRESPVNTVVFEARTTALNRRDAARIEGLRASRRVPAAVRYDFATKSESLLWFADAIAGAAAAQASGDPTYAAELGDICWLDAPPVL